MKKINILFVDDEKFILNGLERTLRKEQYARFYAENGTAALEIMENTPIHVLVTDMKMPVIDGLSLLQKTKKKYPNTVRMALSGNIETSQLLQCINTGEVYRFITKPIIPEELQQNLQDAIDFFLMHKSRTDHVREVIDKNEELTLTLEHQAEVEKKLQHMALVDDLTGLYNRRYLEIALSREFERHKRGKMDLSCLMMDLDHFKQINDTYGHPFGDFVLREFACRLKKNISNEDLVFRYGGEEFFVLLPRTQMKNAIVVGNRILKICKEKPFQNDDYSVNVTVSIGASSFDRYKLKTRKEMTETADKMLYKAKENGRDRIAF